LVRKIGGKIKVFDGGGNTTFGLIYPRGFIGRFEKLRVPEIGIPLSQLFQQFDVIG